MLVALAAVGLLVGVVAGPVLAGSGVQRYQVATTSYTVAVLDTYIHTFVVSVNPCDMSLAITGSTPVDSGYYTTETVTGTLAGGVISFDATYDGPYSPGFAWSGSFPVGGGTLSGLYTGTVTAAPTTFSDYKNHGDYVSSMGGGRDAAHSCIGKPITSRVAPVTDDDSTDADSTEAESEDDNDKAKKEARKRDSREASAIHRGTQAADGRADHPKHPKHPKNPASAKDKSNNGNHGNHSGKP
ncbi:MAG: hypothetical protein M3P84_07300 [Chloroflexota bacterium]|nr:hypothetical protein [Chloroflexota bacterium]